MLCQLPALIGYLGFRAALCQQHSANQLQHKSEFGLLIASQKLHDWLFHCWLLNYLLLKSSLPMNTLATVTVWSLIALFKPPTQCSLLCFGSVSISRNNLAELGWDALTLQFCTQYSSAAKKNSPALSLFPNACSCPFVAPCLLPV